MHILVVNCGSSSVKVAVVLAQNGQTVSSARVERIGAESGARTLVDGEEMEAAEMPSVRDALRTIVPIVLARPEGGVTISGVGHRVVHGGARFSAPTRIDSAVRTRIQELSSLAPLHNPSNLEGIDVAMELLPNVPHVAVFDTAFHASMPRRAKTYALPTALAEAHKIQRYGFHGTSHEYVAGLAADTLSVDLRELRLITCHLGNGASVCAIENGRSVETSMGMTPLEGLVMGSRSGDIDPGILLHLMREESWSVQQADDVLNRQSGLTGLSGVGRDMRDIEAGAADGDDACRMAIQVFSHRLRKYIGAYAAVMGGVDAIVFTGGMGQNSALIRHRVAQRLEFLGAQVDEDLNRDVRVDREQPVQIFSKAMSRVTLMAIATDEQAAIARHTAQLVAEKDKIDTVKTIPIAVSARHIHLTEEAVQQLYGQGYTLTPRNPLSQPGQYACEETLDVIGPKRTIERVRVLGPTRPKNQVEVSRTDEFFLGIDAPVRRSGDVSNTPGITLRGPKGTLQIPEGVICAWRHIHMRPEDAEAFGVNHGDYVEVAIQSGPRELIFGDVLIRVSKKYALEMHIDTDEANAAEINSGAAGVLVPTEGRAVLQKRSTRFD